MNKHPIILLRMPTENRNVCNLCESPNLSRIQTKSVHIRCTACGNGFKKIYHCNTPGCSRTRTRSNVEVLSIYGDEMTQCVHCCR